MTKTYRVQDVARVLKIQSKSARLKLRLAEVKKAGKAYQWDKEQFERVISQLTNDR